MHATKQKQISYVPHVSGFDVRKWITQATVAYRLVRYRFPVRIMAPIVSVCWKIWHSVNQ